MDWDQISGYILPAIAIIVAYLFFSKRRGGGIGGGNTPGRGPTIPGVGGTPTTPPEETRPPQRSASRGDSDRGDLLDDLQRRDKRGGDKEIV
jgi:hypothetical protein